VRIAAAVAGSTLLVSAAAPVVAHWHGLPGHSAALDETDSPGTGGAGASAGIALPQQAGAPTEDGLSEWAQVPVARLTAGREAAARHRAEARRAVPKHAASQPSTSPQPQPQATESAAYRNPLRAVGDLVMERVDMGVDFGGAGPVYALGDGVITNATADSSGWPGGGWITYRLTDGPDAGLMVYVAEDVTPTVQVGQTVTSSTVIANMFNGGDGIETGWATSDGSTAESEMPEAGGISGGGPFPTMVGLSFEALLESLGVPAAPNAGQPGNGLLPAGYPPA
jgi:murein DD-endopeptidase MepM/ murein hydrolase activator NlpD